ncbi:cell division protein FtsK [Sphaerisporangium melleum]|uniref:Cell division protein FtsK n=1 Tax=Sphaerisporangium melleum TaxID=321316 RepID=A0A917RJY4_9ACTN|nr:FtsK/SpoIIIE domain-containing protein [Sphaerisporangium melleum]GGL12032.1 cell division protein FtsK [Sphaerisporangium melleum]GII74374.1 cell division protein FtsK [Sphaerisporangium melleum]
MRLNVSVRTPRDIGVSTVVAVETDPSALVGRLAAELAQAVGPGTGGQAPALYIGAEPLDPQATLYSAGVRDGVELGLGAPLPPSPDPDGVVELRVVSGPRAGTSFRLPPGEYEIGAAPTARVRLPAGAPPVAARVLVRVDRTAEVTAGEGTLLDGRRPSGTVEWPEGSQLAAGDTLLELAIPSSKRVPLTPAADGLGLEFNRPPRFRPARGGGRFRLPTAPTKPDKRPIPLLPILLVPVGGALVAIVSTGRWIFVFLALLSPIGALITQFGGRKQTQVSYQEKLREHEASMERVRAAVDAAVLKEQHTLRSSLPDPASLLQTASQPGERLWERRWQDPDFLDVRVGTADIPSSLTVEDPALEEYRRTTVPTLTQVPVAIPLRAAGVTGVAGPRAANLAGWMAAQAAALHSPGDLRIVVLAGPDGADAWSWVRWLPHCQPQGEDAYALVGSTTDSLARRIGELGQLVATRMAAGPDVRRGGTEGAPDILIVLDQARRARSLPGVVGLLRDGPSVGVYTICLDREERSLPEECTAVVAVDPEGVRVRTVQGAPPENVRVDSPEPGWYEALARALAPLRGVGDSDDNALPTAVRLLDLLRVEPPTPDAIAAGWALSGRSTRAILGAGYDGDFSVDLVRDGPHALIAGTTGAGKSELLQTLVATLAVVNRPDEMTFVLVDYKGGSAFAECADLPHTVGLVTDLDTHLVERALVSLGAELRRREHLLAQAGAKDIEDYLDKRARGGDVLDPLPRLLLVIDEFASMARELPDFISGLVNIAQRGRSLGIHLVLATQRPSGAVTADIRANTNLRIALRTTDTSESRDIIDAPDSGSISPGTPGRAYARLGPSALLPFQAGRVGGRRPSGAVTPSAEAPIRVSEVGWPELGGPLPRTVRTKDATAGQEAITDLAVLVKAIAGAAEIAGVPRQPSPWLPPLPEVLAWTEPAAPKPRADREAPLPAVPYGQVDLPADQDRRPLVLDLDRSGHLHIIGSPRSGRSQTLRTLAAALTRAHGVDDLHLYGIDCGNGALNALTALPHCGVVVERSQIERVGRLLDRLTAELSARQSLLGARGTADLAEYRRMAPLEERPPHIVVMVDRFEVFEREFTNFDNGSYLERMLRLLRDGAGVGIHLVLAGDRILGSARFSGTTEDKIVLRLNDRADYSSVGLTTRSAPSDPPPGRGIRVQDTSEVQIAVLGPDLSGTAQASVLTALGEELRAREAGVPAARRPLRLDLLPDRIAYETAAALRTAPGPMRPLVAVGGDTLTALGPDLADVPTFVIAGPPRTGRSTALLAVARSVLDQGAGVIVLAPRRSPLRDLEGRPGVQAMIIDSEVPAATFRAALGNVPQDNAVILVDDAELFMQSEIDSDLALLARGGAGNGWGLVLAGNAEALSLGLAGWIGQVKRNRTGMLLSPQSLSDGEVIGVRLTRGLIGQAPQPGRGLLHLGDGTLTTVQVPSTESTF